MSTGEQRTITTPDGAMPAYQAQPEGAPYGTVIVIHEAFGLTPHIEDVTRRLAECGYLAVAPALFDRQGAPVMAYDDYEGVLPVISELSAPGIRSDLSATLDHVGGASLQVGITGFCMGGAITLYAATQWPLGAAVTFYGGGVATGRFGLPSLIELAPSIQTSWLGLYGDLDQSIPVHDVERLRSAATKSPAPTEIVRYAEAGHGFHCDSRPNDFKPDAAADTIWITP